MYLLGFGPLPAYAASTLPGHPAPRWPVTLAAALLGLGAHFANVLPDLAADQATGVGGLPQRVAARWGPLAVRAAALALLLAASALLLIGATRPWVADPRAGRRAAARRGVGPRQREACRSSRRSASPPSTSCCSSRRGGTDMMPRILAVRSALPDNRYLPGGVHRGVRRPGPDEPGRARAARAGCTRPPRSRPGTPRCRSTEYGELQGAEAVNDRYIGEATAARRAGAAPGARRRRAGRRRPGPADRDVGDRGGGAVAGRPADPPARAAARTSGGCPSSGSAASPARPRSDGCTTTCSAGRAIPRRCSRSSCAR